MIKAIYHTADWHLRNFQRQEEFEESINLFINEIQGKCKYFEARICITGDLFETQEQVSNEANLIMVKTLKKLLSIHPVIITIGNHDLPKNRTRMDAITPIVEAIANPNLKYSKFSEIFEDDGIVFVHYSFLDNFAVQLQSKSPNKKYVGLYHAPLQNCKNPLNPVFEQKMREHPVKVDLFENCDIVLMGDIHFPQTIKAQDYTAYYCGSLYQQNFGEYVEHHGFGFINMQTLEYQFIELQNSYGKYKVKIDSIEKLDMKFLNVNAQ